MKKLLLLFMVLILNVNLCFAATKIAKNQLSAYKHDMIQVINSILDDKNIKNNTYNDYLVTHYAQETNWYYYNFMKDKNQMKRNYEFVIYANEVNRDINNYYSNWLEMFQPILKKYNLKLNDKQEAIEYISNYYLKKYNIPRTEEFVNLKNATCLYSETMIKITQDVKQYSQQYEKQKLKNFYTKVLEPKLTQNTPVGIMTYLTQGVPFDTKNIYVGNPKVIQILKGGFLADFDPGYNTYFNTIVFVKASDAYKLQSGDYFDPYLPLKFTGQYYTYKTLVGEIKKVPTFTITLGGINSYNLPQIGEQFYFVEKPDLKKINDGRFNLKELYVINEKRAFQNSNRSPYFKFR